MKKEKMKIEVKPSEPIKEKKVKSVKATSQPEQIRVEGAITAGGFVAELGNVNIRKTRLRT